MVTISRLTCGAWRSGYLRCGSRGWTAALARPGGSCAACGGCVGAELGIFQAAGGSPHLCNRAKLVNFPGSLFRPRPRELELGLLRRVGGAGGFVLSAPRAYLRGGAHSWGAALVAEAPRRPRSPGLRW